MNQSAQSVKSNVVPFAVPSKPAGFLVSPRELYLSDAWLSATMPQGIVLQMVIALASYKQSRLQVGSSSLTINAGDLAITQAGLAAKCPKGMTRNMVKSALAYWQKHGVLTSKTVEFQDQRNQNSGPEQDQSKRNRITVISLCNYSEYTVSGYAQNQAQDQNRTRETKTQDHLLISKDLKSVKDLNTCSNPVEKTTDSNDSGESSDPSMFDQFWSVYPKKQGKQKAVLAWKKIPAKLQQTIIDHVTTRKASDPQWLKNGGQFVPHPTTFINGKLWQDEYEGGPVMPGIPQASIDRIVAKLKASGEELTEITFQGEKYFVYATGRVQACFRAK